MISFMASDGKAAVSCNGTIKEIAADMYVVMEALYNDLLEKKGNECGYAFLHLLAINIEVIMKGGKE